MLSNYNFGITVPRHGSDEPIRLPLSISRELQRQALFNDLHTKYETKVIELFRVPFAPKDSLNRLLLEQLSHGSSRHIPKPHNVLKLDTLTKEVLRSFPLTTTGVTTERYKLLRDITVYRKSAERFRSGLDVTITNETKLSTTELSDAFVAIRARNLALLKPEIDAKMNQLNEYMKIQLNNVSDQLNLLGRVEIRESKRDVCCTKTTHSISFTHKQSCFVISRHHFHKLQKLYEINTTSRSLDSNSSELHSRIFCLLSRYMTHFRNDVTRNEGFGMQASLPHYVFEALHRLFDVSMEMFASPFNCFFSQFCSAFPDTDVFFGSQGSFFNFKPRNGGSFQCNPPFTEEVIERMADRIDYLLHKYKHVPLSFIVFIPRWINPPTPGLIKMQRSKYLRKTFVCARNEHKYVTGAQHVPAEDRNDDCLFYNASHETQVFVLQNKMGYAKWRPSTSKIDTLKEMLAFDCNASRIDHEHRKRKRDITNFDETVTPLIESTNKRKRFELSESTNILAKGSL